MALSYNPELPVITSPATFSGYILCGIKGYDLLVNSLEE
jgi:hypothetical protein